MSYQLALDLLLALLIIIAAKSAVNFLEPVFDALHIHWAASKIRKLSELLSSKRSLEKQTSHIQYLERCRETMIQQLMYREHLISDALHYLETSHEQIQDPKLKEIGDDLEEVKIQLWAATHFAYMNYHLQRPNGPRIREYEMALHRREQNPVKFVSQPHRVKDCRLSGSCCSRGCGCCLRPRAILPNGKLFYSHCTAFCHCCMQARGFNGTACTRSGLELEAKGAKVLFNPAY